MKNTKYWSDYFDMQLEKHPDDSVKALIFSNSKLMNQIHDEVLSCIDIEKLNSGSRLLDTGCGPGELLCKLILQCRGCKELEYHATDISGQMLQKAKDRVTKKFIMDDAPYISGPTIILMLAIAAANLL